MRCSRCQQDNRPGVKFCGACGMRVDTECAACGSANPPGNRFCNGCGAGLPAESTRFDAPGTYTPGHLARKILSARERLAGERKQVTVLFADLKGSLELLADRDPEDARALLDAVLERMIGAVHRYEGTVNQVMGDGIMALFGAPLAHEDHAVRACYAALRMHRSVAECAEEFRRRLGVDVQIRVGMNSGEVVVRSIDNDLQMDYSAVGQTTHLAARMEQLARPGATLITGATWRLADRWIEAESQGPVPIKGLREPVEVWELLRAASSMSSLSAISGRSQTRLQGRSRELGLLRERLARALEGAGQVVMVEGEPGVGKTRLLWELTRAATGDGWRTLDAACVSYGALTPYLPIRTLLSAYFGVEPDDEPRRVREKVATRLLALDVGLAAAVSPILALGNVAHDDEEWRALEPPERRQRIFRAVRDLFLEESRRAPLLLVVESLQWIDAESQALLDHLAEHVEGARLVLLFSARTEYRHEWRAAADPITIRLDPLPPESAAALADSMLGGDPSLQPLKRRLVAHTTGNPFFFEELVRTLVETGALEGAPGAYRLAKAVDAIRIPDRVQAVLAARIDRLAEEDKSYLQAAAAIGQDVPVALLQAVTAARNEDLLRGLAELEAAEFLRVATLFPDLSYSFKHAITLDVAYASLLKEQRRILHGRILDALEMTYVGERRAEHIERFADHALRAERWEAAVRYLREAGDRAVARSANREAAAFYEDALRALDHLPDHPERNVEAVDIRLDLRVPLLQLGRLADIHRVSREAEAMAEQLGDESRLARSYTYLINYYYLLGEPARTVEYGSRCLEIAERRQDTALATLARRFLGHSHHAQGQLRLAVQLLEDNVAALDREAGAGIGATISFVASCGWLGWALADEGHFDRADAMLDRARARADASRHPYSQAIGTTLTGLVWHLRGQVERATQQLARALEICNEANLTVWQPIPTTLLGLGLVEQGRHDEGLALLREGVQRAETLGVRAYLARWMAYLGQGLLAAGDIEGARSAGARAMALALAHGERGHEAMAWHLLGEVAAHGPDDADTAGVDFERALDLAEELGLRPLLARTHFTFGRLQRRLGRLTEAEEHLARAVVLFSDMGMRACLEEAQPELRALGHLIIVARPNLELFDYLTQKFAGDSDVRVILDRRRAPAPGGIAAERRRPGREEALRTRGLAIVITR